MWRNPFPAKNTVEHLVLAPDRHITNLGEMTLEDWQAFRNMVYHFHDLTTHRGGAIVMRFGDPTLNAGSVRHIHANIIVPAGTGEVRVTLAKEREEIEHKKKVLCIFEKLRLGTPPKDLTMDEYTLVAGRLD